MPDVVDSFGRSVASGWGVADVGGVWAEGGPSADYGVGSGVGTHRIGALNPVSYCTYIGTFKNGRIRVKVRPNFDPSGSILMAVMARYIDANNYYLFRLRLQATNTDPAQIMILKRLGGTLTTVVAEAAITGSPQSGSGSAWWWIEGQMDQSVLRMKAWRDVDSEPGSYQLSGTDISITTAAGYGCWSQAEAPNTFPQTVDWDTFTATEISKPKPSTLTAIGSVPTPTIRLTGRATPLTVTVSGSLPAPTLSSLDGGAMTVIPDTLVVQMDTYDAAPSKSEFAVPATLSATGSVPTPTGRVADRVVATTVMATGTVEAAMPSITADAADPSTLLATGSTPTPSLRTSDNATPAVVGATGIVQPPSVKLTQVASPPVLAATGFVQTPGIRLSDVAVVPNSTNVIAVLPTPVASVSAKRTPATMIATGTPSNAKGSVSIRALPAILEVIVTVYGDGIVRSSSNARPSTMTAICFPIPAYPLTGDPIEWTGTERVTFTQVLGPSPYIVSPEGIQYGRVKITEV